MVSLTLKMMGGLVGGLMFPFIFIMLPIPGMDSYTITLLALFFMTFEFGGTMLYLTVNMRKAFWKVAQSKDVILIDRRDGFREMASAEYITGWLKSRFGYHLMTDKKPELTTGKMVSIGLDMYGVTIKPEEVAAVEEFAKKNNITSPGELETVLDQWYKCSKCGWEGIPGTVTTQEEVTVGGIKEIQDKIVDYKCNGKDCDGKGENLEKITPSVLVPFYKTVSLESVRVLMKHQMNPSKTVTLVDRLAMIKRGMSEKILGFIGKMLGYGIFVLFVFVGIYLLLQLG